MRNPSIAIVLIEKPKEIYKYAVSQVVRKFSVSSRMNFPFLMAYEPEAFENGNFITVRPGQFREWKIEIPSSLELYFMSSEQDIIEIEKWS